MFEDDGKFVENRSGKKHGDYGKITKTSLRRSCIYKYTSEVKDGTATLTAEKSTGNYTGYKKDKNTTFVVNVSKNLQSYSENGSDSLTPR